MKIKAFSRRILVIPGIVLALICASGAVSANRESSGSTGQEIRPDVTRGQNDYMTSMLNRTKSEGLRNNPLVRKYLGQSNTKWAVRSWKGHLLN